MKNTGTTVLERYSGFRGLLASRFLRSCGLYVLLISLLAALSVPGVHAQVDINAGASWDGWTLHGNVQDEGVYAGAGGLTGIIVDGGAAVTGLQSYFPYFTDAAFSIVSWNGTDNLACSAENASFPSNETVLISRGVCAFSQKIANAKASGAGGVIIYDNTEAGLLTMLKNPNEWDDELPAIFVSLADGLNMESLSLPVTATMSERANWALYTTRFRADGTEQKPADVQGSASINWDADDDIVGISIVNIVGIFDPLYDTGQVNIAFDPNFNSYVPVSEDPQRTNRDFRWRFWETWADAGDFNLDMNLSSTTAPLGTIENLVVFGGPPPPTFGGWETTCESVLPDWTTSWVTPDLSVIQVFLNVTDANCLSDPIVLPDPFVVKVNRRATQATVTVRSEAVGTSTEDSGAVPKAFALAQNYPNPFNPSTTIAFDLPASSNVRLVVFDLLGREVARLVDREMPAGKHDVTWAAGGVPSGMYLYRIEADDFSQTRQMLLLK